MTIFSFMELSIFRQPLFHHFVWLVAFTKSSQKISTYLLTVLKARTIMYLEIRKGIKKVLVSRVNTAGSNDAND